MFEKILVGNDGSDGGANAFTTAMTMAKHFNADLHMICVEELPRFPASIDEIVEVERDARHALANVAEHAKRRADSQQIALQVHLVVGHPVPTIIEFVERNRFELLIVGYMGHSALYNRLIGSTTDRLVELAPCQVLVVK
jgi:nucleotide-binding universal stress UspA family protein